MKTFCITFDVDLTDYLSQQNADELEEAFNQIKAVLVNYPEVKTTWFIRIDYQIEILFGQPDYIFIKHQDKLNWLTDNGHILAWHYHAYHQIGSDWQQHTDEDVICAELEKYAPIAKKYRLAITRMGWGFHTTKTLEKIFSLEFNADSSAIPRPKYKWDLSKRDWENTPLTPYYPSKTDYRITGNDTIGILEIPITTTVIKINSDTEEVKRYINIAYKHEAFATAIRSLEKLNNIVSITHPYELVSNSISHPLYSFDINTLEQNINYLINSGYRLIDMLTLITTNENT